MYSRRVSLAVVTVTVSLVCVSSLCGQELTASNETDYSPRQIGMMYPADVYVLDVRGRLEAREGYGMPAYDMPLLLHAFDGENSVPMFQLLSKEEQDSINVAMDRFRAKAKEFFRRYGRARDAEERGEILTEYKELGLDTFHEIETSIDKSKRSIIRDRLAAAAFYKKGPVKFAASLGATVGEQEAVAANLRENSNWLRSELLVLEQEIARALVANLSSDVAHQVARLYAGVSERRTPVIFVTYADLVEHASSKGIEVDSKSRFVRSSPFVVLDDSGVLRLFARTGLRLEVDRLQEYLYLQSIQGDDSGFDNTAFRNVFESLSDEYQSGVTEFLEKQSAEIDAVAKDDPKAADRIRMKWRSKRAELGDFYIFSINSEMTEKDVELIGRARVLSRMQHEGFISVLCSEWCQQELGYSLTDRDLKRLHDNAEKVADQVIEKMRRLEREMLRRLFARTRIDPVSSFSWFKHEETGLLPPLELMLQQGE